jgi:hypothetical protein
MQEACGGPIARREPVGLWLAADRRKKCVAPAVGARYQTLYATNTEQALGGIEH